MWWEEQLREGGVTSGGDLCTIADARPRPDPRPVHQPIPDVGHPVRPVDQWQWWWEQARRSAQAFLAGHAPPEIAIFGPVLDLDEHGLLEADLSLSWLYGGDGQYRRSDYLVLARPAVMIGALAVNAAINHRRKVAAQRDTNPSWRGQQTVHTWTTTHRLIWEGSQGLDQLWYGDITGFYPDLERWTLTLDTGDGSPPMRLVGPAVPLVSLWIATAVLGPRWAQDPRLSPLLNR